ncbi:MAG: TIGR02757 family protein [Bacteroidota bacterium]
MNRDLLLVKDFLDESYLKYNSSAFIENDPVSIPHLFSKKEDVEIAGFLAATIAWGNRKSIINNALKLMSWMDEAPHDFILNHSKKELKPFEKFVHRTFNGSDCLFFIRSIKNIYQNHGGLESAFNTRALHDPDLKARIVQFRELFLEEKHLQRSEKHISNPAQKSSAKRLCMFLRWMVRQDKKGVDFGIWKNIGMNELCLPLDVHTGNVSRSLGLLQRKQNDWQSVEEITSVLRLFDAVDPVKYDFALFGLGVNKAL